MAAKKQGRQGTRRSMKGFRPGKEPAHLKKRRAKAQLGSDASWFQKQAVEAIAGRRPTEVQALVRKWTIGSFAVAVLLALLGLFLYAWVPIVGVVVHVVTVVLLVLAYRIWKQGPGLVSMAESLQ
jgi:hypothetical protein